MLFLEVIHAFIVGVLISYLSFTNALAGYIERYIAPFQESSPSTPAPLAPSLSAASEELTLLSRVYATTDGVTRVLRDNLKFQEALTLSSNDDGGTSSNVTSDSIIDSLVNIFCEYKTKEYTRTTTGTGFFADEDGVILTNAHVAQFLLLEHADTAGDAECIIRAGNPATPRYHAELLFISPTWILNNAKLISSEMPRGTGEHDYALLYISDALESESLPESFPALPLHTEFLPRSLAGTEVLTAGYPAEKLLRQGARAELTPKIANTTIEDLYTFGSNYADIFLLSPSKVGEHGVSGGPVVNGNDGVLGLIVTKGDVEKDGSKSLRALSLSYIDRTITEETGFSLEANMAGDLVKRGDIFKDALVPFLGRLLVFEIAE